MSQQIPQRPQNVRVVHEDGSETVCELAYGGVDDDGCDLWRVYVVVDFAAGDTISVDTLPARCAIEFAGRPAPVRPVARLETNRRFQRLRRIIARKK